jgi:addiction module RelE/StbE family toxin
LQIRWTDCALDDLEEVISFIREDNPKAANNVVLKVVKSIAMLGEYPSLGKPGRFEGTRELVIADTAFLVPYRVKNKTIEILRVYHNSRKWPEKS